MKNLFLFLHNLNSQIGTNSLNPGIFSKFSSPEQIITILFNLFFDISSLVAVVYIVWGGYTYIMSHGEPSAIEKAKKTLEYSIIGLVVVAISKSLFNFIAYTILGSSL